MFCVSLTKKYVVALTGLMLMGFVLMHMLGNLLVFVGADALNAYAQSLQNLGALLWVARILLLVAVTTHIILAIQLKKQSLVARPQGYIYKNTIQANTASLTMIWSGLTVLAFIVFHLLHFTFGYIAPHHHHEVLDSMAQHDVYFMVVSGFKQTWICISYVVAMICLGFHLYHGGSSVFQSLGINHGKVEKIFSKVGPAFATLIVLGNCAMPLACYFGMIKLVE